MCTFIFAYEAKTKKKTHTHTRQKTRWNPWKRAIVRVNEHQPTHDHQSSVYRELFFASSFRFYCDAAGVLNDVPNIPKKQRNTHTHQRKSEREIAEIMAQKFRVHLCHRCAKRIRSINKIHSITIHRIYLLVKLMPKHSLNFCTRRNGNEYKQNRIVKLCLSLQCRFSFISFFVLHASTILCPIHGMVYRMVPVVCDILPLHIIGKETKKPTGTSMQSLTNVDF